jgi:hypothetical protein
MKLMLSLMVIMLTFGAPSALSAEFPKTGEATPSCGHDRYQRTGGRYDNQ